MKKSTIIHYGTCWSVAIALFFLPIKTTWSNIGLILLLIFTVASLVLEGVDTRVLRKKSFYLLTPVLFFIPVLIGMIYAPSKVMALDEAEKMVFLLLIPILALRKNLDLKKILKYCSYGLIFGSILSAIYLLGIDFYRLSHENLSWRVVFSYRFTNMQFIKPLGSMHPIYMGSYYLMALIFILNGSVQIKKWLSGILTIVLLVAIVFLNSRIIYFSTFLVVLLFLLDRLPWRVFALLLTGFVVVLAISLPSLKNTYVYNRFVNGTVWDLTPNIGTSNTYSSNKSDSRMSQWIAGWELIENKPFIGYGAGTERLMLAKKFKQYSMKVALKQRYNSHNQFLGYMIRFGILGGVLIFVFLCGNFYTAIRNKDLEFLGFLIMITSIFLIENYLDRNMGINFMAIFGTLFYLKHRKRFSAS